MTRRPTVLHVIAAALAVTAAACMTTTRPAPQATDVTDGDRGRRL